MNRVQYIVNLLIAAALLLLVAINRDGKIVGTPISDITNPKEQPHKIPFESYDDDGSLILNTEAVVEKVFGYAGKVPLRIYLSDDKIDHIEIGKNSESPDYLDYVKSVGFLDSWNGLTLAEASQRNIDAVSGATMSSSAIIKNVQIAAAYAIDEEHSHGLNISIKSIFAILVIAFGVIMNIIRPKRKALRILLLLLNIGVLGFWCGNFLSLALLTGWLANGTNVATSLASLLLLAVAILLPLFGRSGAYCSHHCPMGALQEIVGLTNKRKVKIPQGVMKLLKHLRSTILIILLFIMWMGFGFDLMNYEVFTFFKINTASTFVIVMAIVFIILSIIIPRPYCRFICPTGALLTLTQKTNFKSDN